MHDGLLVIESAVVVEVKAVGVIGVVVSGECSMFDVSSCSEAWNILPTNS